LRTTKFVLIDADRDGLIEILLKSLSKRRNQERAIFVLRRWGASFLGDFALLCDRWSNRHRGVRAKQDWPKIRKLPNLRVGL